MGLQARTYRTATCPADWEDSDWWTRRSEWTDWKETAEGKAAYWEVGVAGVELPLLALLLLLPAFPLALLSLSFFPSLSLSFLSLSGLQFPIQAVTPLLACHFAVAF